MFRGADWKCIVQTFVDHRDLRTRRFRVPGPLLFAVHESSSGTRLVPQEATVPASPAPPKPLTLDPTGQIPVRKDAVGNFTLVLKASKKLVAVERPISSMTRSGQPVPLPPIQVSGTDLTISFNGVAPGIYELTLELTPTSMKSETVKVMVEVQP